MLETPRCQMPCHAMPHVAMPDCPDIKKCLSGRENHPDLANTWGRASAQGHPFATHQGCKVTHSGTGEKGCCG